MLPCIKGSQQACVTAVTPTKICSSYSCAVAQHQGIAALPGQNAVPTAQLSPNRIAGQAQHAQECILCITFTVFLCCRLLGLHEQQQGSKRQGCHACWFMFQELPAPLQAVMSGGLLSFSLQCCDMLHVYAMIPWLLVIEQTKVKAWGT